MTGRSVLSAVAGSRGHRLWLIATVLLFLAGLVAPAEAEVFVIAGRCLAQVDPLNGSLIQSTPLQGLDESVPIIGLTYHPGTDEFYTLLDFATEPRLATVDPITGEVVTVGFVDVVWPHSIDLKLVEGLDFNPVDGLLYGTGTPVGPPDDYYSELLLTIDPSTGGATKIAEIVNGFQNEGDALVWVDGVLKMMDGNNITVNLYDLALNGVATYIGELGSGAPASYDYLNRIFYGMSTASELLSISLHSAESWVLGTIDPGPECVGGLRGLAWRVEPVGEVRPHAVPDWEAGDVVLTCWGAPPPFAFRKALHPAGPWVDLTPPGGTQNYSWNDAGSLYDGIDYYYIVEEQP